jgi:hypothetical protein
MLMEGVSFVKKAMCGTEGSCTDWCFQITKALAVLDYRCKTIGRTAFGF